MKVIFLFLCLYSFFISATQAETYKLVTGEYAPYTGENIPHQGVSTMVVKAVFKELRQDISIEFMPWKRGMNYLKNGSVAGSFPWNMSAERQIDLLFSKPIHKYRIFLFTKKGANLKTKESLMGKNVCIASGWDTSLFDANMAAYKLNQVRPITMESCFQMLALKRVDLIVMNGDVGMEMMNRLYQKDSPIEGAPSGLFPAESFLYFVVSRKYPNAQAIITNFNLGLERIKKNGIYDNIIGTLKPITSHAPYSPTMLF